VGVAEGFAVNNDGVWATYCKKCVPVRKEEEKAEVTSEGEVYFPYSANSVAAVKSLPSSRWNATKKCWTVELSENSIVRCMDVFSRMNLKVADNIVKLYEDTKNKTVAKMSGTIGNANLFPYQMEGVAFLTHKDKSLLGDEMGLGKTVQVLCSMDKNIGTIVVCPSSLKYNWEKECKVWRKDLNPIVINNRDDFRIPNAGEVIIINYDIIPDEKQENAAPFMLVCDEVHLTKNYRTKRHKGVKLLASIATKVVGLTGTPITNKPFDLFGVLGSLCMDKEVFGSWGNFLKVFNGQKNRWGGFDFGSPSPIVPELLRRVMLRRLRNDVLPDLPKKTINTITIDCNDPILTELMTRLFNDYESFFAMEELPDFSEFSAIRAKLAMSRLPALIEMIESHEEENIPLIVFSAHKEPVERIGLREGWAFITGDVKPIDRQKIVDDFQNGKLKGVAITIGAGSMGLTLTRAWKAIFLDLDWTPALNSQAEDRICRIGQTKPCEIVRLVSDHVLDIHILNLIAQKMDLFQKAIDDCMTINPLSVTSTGAESQEEYEARMAEAAANKAQEKERNLKQLDPQAYAKKRVAIMLQNEQKRAKGTFSVPAKIEGELKDQIVKGLNMMLDRCDGAIEEDGVGFNKPDACLSRYLYASGLDNQETLLVAYYMLRRYPRQMGDIFNSQDDMA
jgi:SWI/SNF-related matrix-associated actin-dependent regulator 1 of chromatin subfamily A